jgi:hypothetical protein
LNELVELVPIALLLEVERDGPFASIDRKEVAALSRSEVVVDATEGLALRLLYLDYIRAKVTQEGRKVRSSRDCGQV